MRACAGNWATDEHALDAVCRPPNVTSRFIYRFSRSEIRGGSLLECALVTAEHAYIAVAGERSTAGFVPVDIGCHFPTLTRNLRR